MVKPPIIPDTAVTLPLKYAFPSRRSRKKLAFSGIPSSSKIRSPSESINDGITVVPLVVNKEPFPARIPYFGSMIIFPPLSFCRTNVELFNHAPLESTLNCMTPVSVAFSMIRLLPTISLPPITSALTPKYVPTSSEANRPMASFACSQLSSVIAIILSTIRNW